jgi:hypothetical protein
MPRDISEVRFLRELLEKVAVDLERLAAQRGRSERDRDALQRRAQRIRQRLIERDRAGRLGNRRSGA